MKTLFFILIILLFASCNKKDKEAPYVELPPKDYMKKMIVPDTLNPYKGEYYIRADFKLNGSSESKELKFTETTQNMTVWNNPSQPNLGMSAQGMILSDSETHEKLYVHFYFNTSSDTAFTLAYADYWFANPWRNIAGMNIEYSVPVPYQTDETNFAYLYLGENTADSYCNLTYIGNDRINGSFHASWTECCGGPGTYDVYGDFSIPLINVKIYESP